MHLSESVLHFDYEYYYLWGFPKLSSNVKRFFFRNLYFFVLPEHYGIHAIPGTLNSGKFIRSDKFDYRVEHTHNESDSTDQPKKLYMNIENIRKYKHFATPTSRRLVFLAFNFKFTALVSFEDSNFPAFVKNFPYITRNMVL